MRVSFSYWLVRGCLTIGSWLLALCLVNGQDSTFNERQQLAVIEAYIDTSLNFKQTIRNAFGTKKTSNFSINLDMKIRPDGKFRQPVLTPRALSPEVKRVVCANLKKNDLYIRIFLADNGVYSLEVYPLTCPMFDNGMRITCTFYFYFSLSPSGVVPTGLRQIGT